MPMIPALIALGNRGHSSISLARSGSLSLSRAPLGDPRPPEVVVSACRLVISGGPSPSTRIRNGYKRKTFTC